MWKNRDNYWIMKIFIWKHQHEVGVTMTPTTKNTNSIGSYDIFNLSENGVRETMSTEEIIESFKESTGIAVIRASKEGVLKDYNVETDFPEVLGAMLATVYGASVTALADFSEKRNPIIKINSGDRSVIIVSSSDDIVAVFVPEDATISDEEVQSLSKKLEESDF